MGEWKDVLGMGNSTSKVMEVNSHGVLLETENTLVCLSVKYEQGEKELRLLPCSD